MSRDFPEVADVVATILAKRGETEQLQIVELTPQLATLVSKKQHVIRVFVNPIEDGVLAKILDRCLAQNPPGGTECVLLGGRSKLEHVIRAELPKMPRHPFTVVHLAEDAPLAAFPDGTSRAQPMLRTLADITLLRPDEADALRARVAADQGKLFDERQQAAGFFQQMRERKAPATKALLVAIGILFALQALWGFDNETAYAMGALHEPSVKSGEWWRLISAGFLHANLAHVGMNGFALYLLGGQTEKVLGAPRYLIIYTASLLGGSVASMMRLTPEMISLGASGAIWGLLGAQTALAFGRPKILPESVARSMKPMVMQNLLINVGISFIGGIDWAAHFGGGFAGGLVLASGVLYLTPDREGRAPGWIAGLAKGCVAVMAIGVAVALYAGQPWRIHQEIAELMAVPPAR